MSEIQQKTLFDIVIEVLEKFKDSNLYSEDERQKIADEICGEYYCELEIPDDNDYPQLPEDLF